MKTTDEILAEEAEQLFGRSSGSGQKTSSPKKGMVAGHQIALAMMRTRAVEVRQHIQAWVKNHPEVMVKITGSSPDIKGMAASADYIARGGKYKKKDEPELDIENENGDVFSGKEGREALLDEWRNGGYPVPDSVPTPSKEQIAAGAKKPKREVLKVIFSMPSHVGRAEVDAAAKAAISQIFAGHQWALTHHSDTDNQHTHVIIKMVDRMGKRMDPRKDDLGKWRAVFAKELQARGVEAVATRRKTRLKREKGLSQARLEMRKRGLKPQRDETAVAQAVARAKALENESKIVGSYERIAQALARSEQPSDAELARQLTTKLSSMGHTVRLSFGGPAPKM